jgi:hypothetical protein
MIGGRASVSAKKGVRHCKSLSLSFLNATSIHADMLILKGPILAGSDFSLHFPVFYCIFIISKMPAVYQYLISKPNILLRMLPMVLLMFIDIYFVPLGMV